MERVRVTKLTDDEIKQYIPYWEEEGLTMKQLKFVFFYCHSDFNAAKAYRTAYDMQHKSAKDLSRLGSISAKNPKIKRAIKRYLQEYLGVQKDKLECILFDILYAQATFLPSDIIDEDGNMIKPLKRLKKELQWCVAGIKTKWVKGVNEEEIKDENGEIQIVISECRIKQQEVELVDRDRAVEKLQKYINMINDVVEIKHSMTEETERKLDNMFSSSRVKIQEEGLKNELQN